MSVNIISYSCADCDHLDKSRKQYYNEEHYCYRYGCNYKFYDKESKCDGFIHGWILRDRELKLMSCSDFKCTKYEQLSLF